MRSIAQPRPHRRVARPPARARLVRHGACEQLVRPHVGGAGHRTAHGPVARVLGDGEGADGAAEQAGEKAGRLSRRDRPRHAGARLRLGARRRPWCAAYLLQRCVQRAPPPRRRSDARQGGQLRLAPLPPRGGRGDLPRDDRRGVGGRRRCASQHCPPRDCWLDGARLRPPRGRLGPVRADCSALCR